jgi:predicted nucleic acid-binding protein
LCEILQGIRGDSTSRASGDLSNFEVSRGHTVRRTIDCLIATFCLAEGHSLLHRDRDFDPFE